MKCVCGYEHEEEWNQESKRYNTTIGKKAFKRVEGHFTMAFEANYGSDIIENVSLCACPECDTIKLNR